MPGKQKGAHHRKGRASEPRVRMQSSTNDSRLAFTSTLESADLLWPIFAAMTEGVVVHAPDGRVLAVNASAETLLELTRHQLLGKTPMDLDWRTISENGDPFPGSEHPAMVTARTGQPIRNQVMGIQRSAITRRWISVNSQPVFSASSDSVIAVVATFIDVTDRKRRESNLEEQNVHLSQALSVRDQFLAGISHELRTPLNAIIGFSQLAYDGKLDGNSTQGRQFIGHVLESGKHLLHLVDNLLDLARLEAGQFVWHPERINLIAITKEVTQLLHPLADAKHVSIITEIDQRLAEVVLDPCRVRQILFNYLSNAIKFTAERSAVILRANIVSGKLRIEVEDRGVGIDADDLPKLFTEFEQLGLDHVRKRQGSGLGLALTRKIVESRGGTVEVVSVLGAGSTFSALVPLDP